MPPNTFPSVRLFPLIVAVVFVFDGIIESAFTIHKGGVGRNQSPVSLKAQREKLTTLPGGYPWL